MAQRSLELSVTPGAWNLFRVRRRDPKFKPLEKKVFSRDKHTCQFCHFQAKQYFEVINLDRNYRHNKGSNLVTACPFCAQCFFLDAIGQSDFGGGNMVYMPELSQAELNSLCHVLFCAMANKTEHAKTAQSLYRVYKLRSHVVEETLGEGMSQPGNVGQLLLELSGEHNHQSYQNVLKDIRLLPARSRFEKQIAVWAKAQANLKSGQSDG